jgi:hypothetical protein
MDTGHDACSQFFKMDIRRHVIFKDVVTTESYKVTEAHKTIVISLSTRINNINLVRFEVFTAVTMKNGVFWDVTPCGSCKNRRFRRNLAPPSTG